MTWKTIDSTDALQALDYKVCWEDGEILETYRVYSNQSYFPKDVNRSGYNNPNLHLLIDTGFGENELLELVLIETDLKSINSLSGHLSPLNIVHLTRGHASRIIYRWIDNEKQYKAGYFVENWETIQVLKRKCQQSWHGRRVNAPTVLKALCKVNVCIGVQAAFHNLKA